MAHGRSFIQVDYFDRQRVNYTYTADGLQQTVIDGRGTTSYAYDDQDRLIGITQPDGQELRYSYDLAGNRLSMTTQAGTIRYSYDGAGQLVSVSDPSGGVSRYTYDSAGLRTQLILPNGVTVDYGYDALDRLTSIDQHFGAAALASYAYMLDPAGNRLSVTEADGSSIQWTYDDAYRLLSETRRDGSNAVTYQVGFSYDAVGNRLTQTVGTVTTQYTYNDLDQLLTAGAAQYRYDGRGNLAQVNEGADVTQYAYDAADRLNGVTLPDGTSIAYTYDAAGRRVRQSAAAQVTNYLWDEISAYGDVVLETDGSGSTLASYVLGGAELLSQMRGGVTDYYLHDGQGSVRALTDDSGAVTDTYAYMAFGELYAQTGSTANAYLYTGQQFDSPTGLYSLRARYYDPENGRFLSRDTICCSIQKPSGLNLYNYVEANPTNYVDPTGHDAFVGYLQTYQLSLEAQQALTLVGIATSCALLNVTSHQMAINHDRIGLLLLEMSMPSPTPCHIPVLMYPGLVTPMIGLHIQSAQAEGWPMLLHYLGPYNPQRGRNYNHNCSHTRRKEIGGLSCDEYPFSSTIEGGAASTRGVPIWEQLKQGWILYNFYGTKLFFRPFAAFAVVVWP